MKFGTPFFSATLALALSGAAVPPPAPYGVTPTPAQVKNAERAFYAFCHFTVTTFANREWVTGGESETVFNPTQFDADQIITALKAGGAKGMILTCKHHDGFGLWPTKTTRHNISNSPFRDGKGDMVGELADSCRKHGPDPLLDTDLWSAWVSDDAVTTPEVTLTLPSAKTFNLIRLREDIRLGLRLEGLAVDAMVNGEWKELAKAEAIGSCRLWRVPATTTEKLRIRVTKAPVCPTLSDFGLFLEPELPVWVPPVGGVPKVEAMSRGKFIKFVATRALEKNHAVVAELGVIEAA